MWHTLSTEEIAKKLHTDIAAGLQRAEIEKRIKEEGENRIPEEKSDTIFIIFLKQFQSPLIFILCAAAGISILFLKQTTDAFIIFFVLILNAVIGTLQEGKARNTLSALKQFTETSATVLRHGKETVIPDAQLVPGDIIILQEGEKIPADARVIESYNLSLDEAALTGESHSVHKTAEKLASASTPVSEQVNMVFKGSYVVAGNGRAIVIATGVKTMIGGISKKISLIDSEIPLKTDIRALSRLIMATVAAIITALFFGGIAAGKSAAVMFAVAISLTVSIIPEGLPVVLTIVLISGVHRMAKRNALVKRLQAVEALGQARVIAVDKTGTLTKNEMVVRKLYAGEHMFDISGTGYESSGEVKKEGLPVDAPDHPELLLAGKIAALCANARVAFIEETDTFRVAGDPTEAALAVFAQKIGFHKSALENESPKINEIPFSYQTKYHATSHLVGDTQLISVVGAPEAVMLFATHIFKNEGVSAFSRADRLKAEEILFQMSANGLRVIACATAQLPQGKKFERHDHLPPLTFVGFYGMQDALRAETPAAIAAAQNAGIKVVLITGDHKITAMAIAKEAGIYKEGDGVLTGHDMEILSDSELAAALSRTTVFTRVTPDDKLRIIEAYKRKGEIIAMTGDGINDAPSLVAADLGIAMGKIGTEVAKEASDIVLLDDNFTSIVSAIEEGRNIYKTIKRVILYLFSTSIGEVLVIGGAIFLGYPLPILAAQILWLNLVTDGFLDVALTMEPKEKNVLKKSFERPKKYLVDRLMLKRMCIMAIPMMTGTLFLFKEYFPYDLPKAMTVALTALAVFQWFNAWNCRSEDRSLFATNPFSNPYLVSATLAIIGLHLMAVYAPFMQYILKTVPLGWYDWLLITAVAFSIVVAEEIRKMTARYA